MLSFRGVQLGLRGISNPTKRAFSQSVVMKQEIIDFMRFKTGPSTGKDGSNSGKDNMSLSSMMQSPREDALNAKLTGIKAGRTIDVFSGNTMNAMQRLNSVVRSTGIQRDKRAQRFYLKPGKARELRRSLKHRRDFMKSFKHLIEVVKDAKRKGY